MITLCEILRAFSRTSSSEVMPCASFDLKLAVNKARMGGLLERSGDGYVLSDSGVRTLSECRKPKPTTKKGKKK